MGPVSQFVKDVSPKQPRHWPKDIHTRFVEFLEADQSTLLELVEKLVFEIPRSSHFIHIVASQLDERQLSDLVKKIFNTPGFDWHCESASEFVRSIARQFPNLLKPYLHHVFSIDREYHFFHLQMAWKQAVDKETARLLELLKSSQYEERRRAILCLVWAGNTHLESPVLRDVRNGSDAEFLDHCYRVAGKKIVGNSVVSLASDTGFHLQFPRNKCANESTTDPFHLTWRIDLQPLTTAVVGGDAEANCSLCGRTLCSLIRFYSSDIAKGEKLPSQFVACLTCLGWDVPAPFFYEHLQDGKIRCLQGGNGSLVPAFEPTANLVELHCDLCPTPNRWRYQSWSGNDGNLNRVLGPASWVQDPDYPNCNCCGETMHFAAQLDSCFLTRDGVEFLWGSGGMGYFFFCSNCSVSAALWQCT